MTHRAVLVGRILRRRIIVGAAGATVVGPVLAPAEWLVEVAWVGWVVELAVAQRGVVVLLKVLRERQNERKFLTKVVDKVPNPCVLRPLPLQSSLFIIQICPASASGWRTQLSALMDGRGVRLPPRTSRGRHLMGDGVGGVLRPPTTSQRLL